MTTVDNMFSIFSILFEMLLSVVFPLLEWEVLDPEGCFWEDTTGLSEVVFLSAATFA